jgi:nucleotide-binding universal stress UspA family protein
MRTIDLQTQIKFERILLATDFSACAERAQAYAVGLARQDSSALELTTVVKLPALDALSECALDSFRRASAEDLRRMAEPVSGVKVTRKVIEGFQPAAVIVDEAVEFNADLIVLGTTSKHGLMKLALGSTAEEVIRTAYCPVLTVGPHVRRPMEGPVSFHRIVYATDFSAQAAKGADLALALGRTEGAKVYLCHVLGHALEGKAAAKDSGKEERCVSFLKALVPEKAHCWCDPECVVEHGKASEAILALAKRVDADLIVLGARKASFWVEFVRTGLTPALLAEATCPVLTVC